MKALLLFGIATLCFAAWEPIVSYNSLRAVEASMNDKIRSNINDPYGLMAPARGTYLEGYGAVFTVEMNLVMVSPLNFSPFNPSISEKEVAAMHEHKERKLEELRLTLRGLMTGASQLLPGLPGDEHVVMEAFLFNYNWELTRGLPHRITLTATKQKLLDAASRHAAPADIAALFEEREL